VTARVQSCVSQPLPSHYRISPPWDRLCHIQKKVPVTGHNVLDTVIVINNFCESAFCEIFAVLYYVFIWLSYTSIFCISVMCMKSWATRAEINANN
jgi:hypothetical protein